ncbi:MAG: folate-binding protein [Alphaproteobacteria bacterium]
MPFTELTDRGVLTVAGADRESFLQGLVSNDVAAAMQGQPVWAALLSPQGKYKHDFFILADGDRLLLDCEGGDRLMDLGRTLRKFILRSDVTLGIEKDVSALVVWGEDAAGLADGNGVIDFAGGKCFADPRLPSMGVRILAPAEPARAALSDAGLIEGPVEAWHAWRIAMGVPDGSRDLDVEKSILLEAGFDELHGIDWKKGCYMGQELTARTKYRGLVKRRLVPVRVDGDGVAAGADITLEGRVVGTLKSVALPEKMALATLRLDAIKQDTGPLKSGDAVLVPDVPGWLSLA